MGDLKQKEKHAFCEQRVRDIGLRRSPGSGGSRAPRILAVAGLLFAGGTGPVCCCEELKSGDRGRGGGKYINGPQFIKIVVFGEMCN